MSFHRFDPVSRRSVWLGSAARPSSDLVRQPEAVISGSARNGSTDDEAAQRKARMDDLEQQSAMVRKDIDDLEKQAAIDQEMVEHLEAVVEGDEQTIANLKAALATSRRIGMAMGILMATGKVTEADAFEQLRIASQHENAKLHVISERVVLTGFLERRGSNTSDA